MSGGQTGEEFVSGEIDVAEMASDRAVGNVGDSLFSAFIDDAVLKVALVERIASVLNGLDQRDPQRGNEVFACNVGETDVDDLSLLLQSCEFADGIVKTDLRIGRVKLIEADGAYFEIRKASLASLP